MTYTAPATVLHGERIDETDYNLLVTDIIDHQDRLAAVGTTNANLPYGTIIWYYGLASALTDTGWAICDGTNGTPDLRDRFIVGAGDTYAIGETGGNNSTHQHTLASTDSGGSHNHSLSATTGNASTSNGTWGVGSNAVAINPHTHTVGYSTSTNSGHTHANQEPGAASAYPPEAPSTKWT